MSKTKSERVSQSSPLSAWVQGNRRNLLLGLAVLGGLSYAAREAWTRYGATHAHWEQYSLPLSEVKITPPPNWVRSDVRGDVGRIGTLQKLSLLDHDVTRDLAQAFSLHPWVAKVNRVVKAYPASIQVDLEYRRPVAMVEVEHQGKPGLLPVDRQGYLLPPDDFAAAEVKSLPRLSVGKTYPAGAVGTSWDDPRVSIAALVAEGLVEDWTKYELFQIVAQPLVPGDEPTSLLFEITTRTKRKYIWGHAPGHETSGEAPAGEKRRRLFDGAKNASLSDTVDLR